MADPVLQPALDPAAVVATALDLVGRPYAFGGATPSGFDSSGFTHYGVTRTDGRRMA